MPTVQVASFSTSDAFAADSLRFKDELTTLSKTGGVKSVYYGFQHEDNHIAYLFVILEGYEDHTHLAQYPQHSSLVSFFHSMRIEPPAFQHVDFNITATSAFNAPTTETAFLTPKVGASLDEYNANLNFLCENLANEKACHSVLFGEIKEKKDSHFMAIGWDNIQAHVDTVSLGVFPGLVKRLFELADIQVTHTNLILFKPDTN